MTIFVVAFYNISKTAAGYDIDASDGQKGQKTKVEKPVLITSKSFNHGTLTT